VTAALSRPAAPSALAPITGTLRAMFGNAQPTGLAPGLLLPDPSPEWVPATQLTDGTRLPELLDAAIRRWTAPTHVAAALAWKAYTYWLALPAVLGWASARRVPLVHPADVLVHFEDHRPLLTLGLRPTIRVAVLPSDPLAAQPVGGTGLPEIVVVPDAAALLGALRAALLDAHLTPLLDRIRAQVHLGARTLLGSLASGVAYGVLRAADVLPGSVLDVAGTLLSVLDVADLVDILPGADGTLTVQRKTCCLAFTLPEPKICSGCCISPGIAIAAKRQVVAGDDARRA
jgi:Ferric iron reductase FhuF-like transporter